MCIIFLLVVFFFEGENSTASVSEICAQTVWFSRDLLPCNILCGNRGELDSFFFFNQMCQFNRIRKLLLKHCQIKAS